MPLYIQQDILRILLQRALVHEVRLRNATYGRSAYATGRVSYCTSGSKSADAVLQPRSERKLQVQEGGADTHCSVRSPCAHEVRLCIRFVGYGRIFGMNCWSVRHGYRRSVFGAAAWCTYTGNIPAEEANASSGTVLTRERQEAYVIHGETIRDIPDQVCSRENKNLIPPSVQKRSRR